MKCSRRRQQQRQQQQQLELELEQLKRGPMSGREEGLRQGQDAEAVEGGGQQQGGAR